MIEIFRFRTQPLDSNCYVIKDSSSKSAVVIDPGHPRTSALKFIEENGLNVEYILLTHRHFDHVLGTSELARKTGAKVAIHQLDAVGLESSEDSLFDMQLMSKCKHNICANSTFSFWGARLNQNQHKLMIRPLRHDNYESITASQMHENWPGWILIDAEGKIC